MKLKSILAAVTGVLLSTPGYRSVTKYVSPKQTVKVTRRFRPNARGREDLLVTIGRPNFRDRKRIKTFVKCNEPFPVRKVAVDQFKKKKR